MINRKRICTQKYLSFNRLFLTILIFDLSKKLGNRQIFRTSASEVGLFSSRFHLIISDWRGELSIVYMRNFLITWKVQSTVYFYHFNGILRFIRIKIFSEKWLHNIFHLLVRLKIVWHLFMVRIILIVSIAPEGVYVFVPKVLLRPLSPLTSFPTLAIRWGIYTNISSCFS